MRFTGKSLLARFEYRLHQRRHVSAIEVNDVGRDVEEVPLAWNHRADGS
jgi:hypothetical protein